MRILITAGFIGKYGETDGVVTTYKNLLQRFAEDNTEVDLVAYGHEDSVERIGPVTIYTHRPRLPLKVDPCRWIDLAFAYTGLARMLAARRYDLIQSSTPDTLGIWASRLSHKLRCPMISIYHTALDQYAEIRASRWLGRAAGRIAGHLMDSWLTGYFNMSSLVLAPSLVVKSEYGEHLRPPIEVLSRGVNTDLFTQSHRSRQNGKTRALYVGRVAPEKNLPLLERIFRDRSDLDLMVVGDGPYLEHMRKALPHSLLPGRLLDQELHAAYADADFFVFPSRTDTLGNVVIEAMSSGLPVVVTDSLGPKELVDDGVTGFVARSDGEFVDAVNRLASDEILRKQMGTAAREAAKQRSWDTVYSKLNDYYRQQCESFATSRGEESPRFQEM